MPDILQVGPFMLKTGPLAVILAAAAGLAAIRMQAKRGIESAKPLAEWLLNEVMIVVLFWKFGHVLFSPSLLLQRPTAVLLANGGAREVAMGLAVAAVHVLVRLRRRTIPAAVLLDLLAVGCAVSVAVGSALWWRYGKPTAMPWGISLHNPEIRYHPVHVYMLLISAGLLFRLWRKARAIGTGKLFQDAAVGLGSGMLLVSLFEPAKPAFAYLSFEQLAGVALAGAGIISSVLTHNREGKEMTALMKETQPNDSAAQRRQAEQNAREQRTEEPIRDKKTDGPNRPST